MVPFTRSTMTSFVLAVVFCLSAVTGSSADAQAVRNRILMRVFWQDRETAQLSWADITSGDKWGIKRAWIHGFPMVDAENQELAPMKHHNGVLVTGVRDHQDGTLQSGWISVDTGVFEEPHGNHTHWKYAGLPQVTGMKLDAHQGNPGQLSVSENIFYLAHDQKNGFSQLQPSLLKQASSASESAKFFSGGGSHIALAAVNDAVAYSSWDDESGPNGGRVDVVPLRQAGMPKIAYSFQLPSAAIHGITHNSGKVFLAPADGICWVKVDLSLKETAESVQVNYLSLGQDELSDRPVRTGTFSNARNWVLCTTGEGDQSKLCLINAESADPSVVKVNVPAADGLRLTAPETVLSLGNRYAFLFQERTDAVNGVQEQLTVVELDPDRNRDFSDARIRTTIPVGASRTEGHHAIAFDAYGRYAAFTEPGEGILNLFSLQEMQVVARFKVGGSPDRIVAVGAPEHFH